MAKKSDQKGVGSVIQGRIQYLSVFNFDVKKAKELDEHIDKIKQSKLVLGYFNEETHEGELKDDVLKEMEECDRKTAEEACNYMNQELQKISGNKMYAKLTQDLDKDEEKIPLFSMNIQNEYSKHINLALESMIMDRKMEEHYGVLNNIRKVELLLQILKGKINGIETYIYPFLSVYNNGTAVLSFEYEMRNVNIKYLSTERLDIPIDELQVYGLEEIIDYRPPKENETCTIASLRAAFQQIICIVIGAKYIKVNNESYTALALYDYTSKIESFGYSPQLYEDIFYLIAAPVVKSNESSKKMMRNEVEQSHWELTEHIHAFVSSGSKIVICNYGDAFKVIKEEGSDSGLEEEEMRFLFERALLEGVTPIIKVKLIKNYINSDIRRRCSNLMKNNLIGLLKLKMDIHALELFKLECLYFRYNTMIELLDFIERRNKFGLLEKNTQDLYSIFNEVIASRESMKRNTTSTIINTIAFILTVLLSYIGLKDMLIFANEYYGWQMNQIDLANTVLVMWIILTIIVSIVFGISLIKLRKKSNRLHGLKN